jgi:hypothetical protein
LAIYFNSTAARLSRTGGGFLEPSGDFTYCFWFKFVGASPGDRVIHTLSQNASPSNPYLAPYMWEGDNGAGNLGIYGYTDPAIGGVGEYTESPASSLVAGQWYHLAVVWRASDGAVLIYLDGVAISISYSGDPLDWDGVSFAAEYLANDPNPTPGSSLAVAYYRSWSAQLTAAEIAIERQARYAFRSTNLFADTPLVSDADLTDHSGNGHDWTLSGSVSYLAGPLSMLLKVSEDGDDAGVPCQAFWKSRGLLPGNNMANLWGATQLGQPVITAKVSDNVELTLTMDRDMGLETSDPATVDLTPDGVEIGTIPTFEGAAMDDISVLQVQVGDGEAQSSQWSLDELVIPVSVNGPK